MKEIIIQIENYLKMEYKINASNYILDLNDWSKLYEKFKNNFLTNETKDRWYKIENKPFTEEKIKKLHNSVFERKIYIIKFFNQENIEMVNAFCSWCNDDNDLRDCLNFKIFENKIKLYSIDTVCENCFGAGFLDNNKEKCSGCLGSGFSFSNTLKYVNWKTPFRESKNITETFLLNSPCSDIQKKMVALNN